MNKKTIFEIYLSEEKFIDRFKKDKKDAVDVIIPIVHTNELWRKNLLSIYREIPVKRLLIGDGGCIDDSLKIALKFPRVKIFNHRKFVSLGFSIRKLIEEVQTPWFIYLHSDIYLPEGWFNEMTKHKSKYDWFECRQHHTLLIDFPLPYPPEDRSLSGSQMGRKEAFKKILPQIDDDYLYRNEDMIYADLIKGQGYKYGRVASTFHFHQIMNKRSAWLRTIKNVSFKIEKSPKEESREWIMQIKGIIKYTDPRDPQLIQSVQGSLLELLKRKDFNFSQFEKWVKKTNPKWLIYLHLGPKKLLKNQIQKIMMNIYHYFVK